MGFFALGINHKTCPVEIREKIHFQEKDIARALRKAREEASFSELLVLSTCNRMEFYGYTEKDFFPEERVTALIQDIHRVPKDFYGPYLYRYESKEAIRHLFRVAAGLDSLVVGENEILGQLREAFRMANEAGSVHSFLYRLMEKAIHLGKSVRTQTRINEGAVSIPSVAVELAEKIYGKLTREKVMVLGSGEMSELTLKNLKSAGAQIAYVVSRSKERGVNLAAGSGAQRISFEGWETYLPRIDILIASTSAPHPVVDYDQVKAAMPGRRQTPLFMIDISVPRNIDPRVNEIDQVYLYNIDDLRGVSDANLKLRSREINAAEEWVQKAVLEYQSWLEQLKARPVLEKFEKFLDEVLEKELGNWADSSRLEPFSKDDLRRRIRAKLMHPPFEKIKEASQNGGVARYLEALHSLFDLKNKK